MSFLIVMGVRRSKAFSPKSESPIRPDMIVTLMGNLPALLHIIIFLYMLDIFNYNAFNKHIFPLWLLLVIIFVLTTVVFITFVVYIAAKAIRESKS